MKALSGLTERKPAVLLPLSRGSIRARQRGQTPLGHVNLRALLVCAWLGLCASLSPAQTLDKCRDLQGTGQARQADACYQQLLSSADPYVRAEAAWALEQYQAANESFRSACERAPKNALCRARWGRFYLDRRQWQDAGKLFAEALEIQPDHPEALLGLALVSARGYERKAVELAGKAIASDPKLVDARVLLSRLALEDGNESKAAEEARKALEVDSKALDAMAMLAAIDWLNDDHNTPWAERILKINPMYGEAFATAGHFLVLNRRYEEGVRFYRRAIELNPRLHKARVELGINLMRLGLDDEAREHLELSYSNGERYAEVVNPLRLLDSYRNFETFTGPATVLRLHRREADFLRPYFESELTRAIRTFEKKYGMRLERPVRLEVYPDHEDFAVRALGMPGLGALGVAFGNVVAMDSPSGRKPGSFHWASTLWHELSHVFVLTATGHRVPRWFTEGMAVYEETEVSPDWGDRITPDVIEAVREKKLLPVAQLDRGFVRPEYPAQVVVSYFQAGQLCGYIAEKWGYRKLLDMMHAFGKRKSTPEVIVQELALAPEELDKAFFAWLDGKLSKTVQGFGDWKNGIRKIAASAKAGQHSEVIEQGRQIRDLYPDYVEDGSVYEFLAESYLALGDKARAREQLAAYARIGGRHPEVIKRLAGLLEEAGQKAEAARALEKLNYVYPQDEDLQRRLGTLWLEQGNAEGAVRAFHSVLALKPLDRAAAHFNLASAYRAARKNEQALEQVILALEAAPGYRPAQRLLLELSQ